MWNGKKQERSGATPHCSHLMSLIPAVLRAPTNRGPVPLPCRAWIYRASVLGRAADGTHAADFGRRLHAARSVDTRGRTAPVSLDVNLHPDLARRALSTFPGAFACVHSPLYSYPSHPASLCWLGDECSSLSAALPRLIWCVYFIPFSVALLSACSQAYLGIKSVADFAALSRRNHLDALDGSFGESRVLPGVGDFISTSL